MLVYIHKLLPCKLKHLSFISLFLWKNKKRFPVSMGKSTNLHRQVKQILPFPSLFVDFFLHPVNIRNFCTQSHSLSCSFEKIFFFLPSSCSSLDPSYHSVFACANFKWTSCILVALDRYNSSMCCFVGSCPYGSMFSATNSFIYKRVGVYLGHWPIYCCDYPIWVYTCLSFFLFLSFLQHWIISRVSTHVFFPPEATLSFFLFNIYIYICIFSHVELVWALMHWSPQGVQSLSIVC